MGWNTCKVLEKNEYRLKEEQTFDLAMSEKETSYKNSLKATSLFGGVQIYKIIIQIVRSKCVAIFLGPEGMGIMSLLNSTISMISSFTNCGLSSSAVRNIADASNVHESKRISTVITVLRRLIWFTGLVGTLICAIGSSLWSKMAFGNSDFTIAFILLAINVLFFFFFSGQRAILQGLQKYRYLAVASIIGEALGLAICVPLYYVWGVDAIVPVLVLVDLSAFLLTWYYSHKVKIPKVNITRLDIKSDGGNMIKMGILISLSTLLGTLASYLIRIYIRDTGNIADVGLYGAGFTLVESYVGLVFAAMATDYYPRLSKVAKDNRLFGESINSQAEIAIILLAPIVIAFVVFARLGIIILYSEEFLSIEGMVYWAIAAILIKALAWSMSYAVLAKGDTRVFFWNEFATLIYGFILNVIGYKLYGLTGMGVSFFVKYVIYFVQLAIVTKKQYAVRLNLGLVKLFSFFFAFVILSLLLKLLDVIWVNYLLGIVLLTIVTLISYKELDRRVALTAFIHRKIKNT